MSGRLELTSRLEFREAAESYRRHLYLYGTCVYSFSFQVWQQLESNLGKRLDSFSGPRAARFRREFCRYLLLRTDMPTKDLLSTICFYELTVGPSLPSKQLLILQKVALARWTLIRDGRRRSAQASGVVLTCYCVDLETPLLDGECTEPSRAATVCSTLLKSMSISPHRKYKSSHFWAASTCRFVYSDSLK